MSVIRAVAIVAEGLCRASTVVVGAMLAWGVVHYGSPDTGHAATQSGFLAWHAAGRYLRQDFSRMGFGLVCETHPKTGRWSCRVEWSPGGSPAASQPAAAIVAYECDVDGSLRRDTVLAHFYEEAAARSTAANAAHAAGVLDGFFQSGLRRTCDQVIARSDDAATASLPPFDMEAHPDRSLARRVTGVDASYGTIPIGIPIRPTFRGDVLAQARWTAPGEESHVNVVTLSTGNGLVKTLLMSPQGGACTAAVAGASLRVPSSDCNHVEIVTCSGARVPASDVWGCEPIGSLFSAGQGQVLAYAVSRADVGSRVRVERNEPIILSDDGTGQGLNIGGHGELPGVLVNITAGSRMPVSRVQMRNGRWHRWYADDVANWLEPVVAGFDRTLSTAGLPDAIVEKPIRLTVGLEQQRLIEQTLSDWMRAHAEAPVVAHLEADIAAAGNRRYTLKPLDTEKRHRRVVPQAGVTVLDAESGAVVAVASYPPAAALSLEDGRRTFGPGWKARMIGSRLPAWAVQDALATLEARILDDVNANFVTHPIGSTFKPILLSLMIDPQVPGGPPDHLDEFFTLKVAGHTGGDGIRIGGDRDIPLTCGGSNSTGCTSRDAQAVVGLPAGPWGREEASSAHVAVPWIDRREFLLASCNRYAMTLGVLTLLSWNAPGSGLEACCWNTNRDRIMVGEGRSTHVIANAATLPALGPWTEIRNGRLTGTQRLADAPVFARLQSSYGVSPRASRDRYDSAPWQSCMPEALRNDGVGPFGSIAATQFELGLQEAMTGSSFTRIFTGASPNRWTNIKLAEAYARVATNRRVRASFCQDDGPPPVGLFQDRARHVDIVKILSEQRQVSWVHTPAINAWVREDDRRRMTFSKTGTTPRSNQSEQQESGVFAIYIGRVVDRDVLDGKPTNVGAGFVVVAHIDDIGASTQATQLVDAVFPHLKPSIRR